MELLLSIRGIDYFYTNSECGASCSVNDKEIVAEYAGDWESTINILKNLVLKELGLVYVVWKHYRNVFKRDGMDTKLHPFFRRYLNCNQHQDTTVKSNEGVRFEGFECGYYYPAFTINKALWESAYLKIPRSYVKNIVEYYGIQFDKSV